MIVFFLRLRAQTLRGLSQASGFVTFATKYETALRRLCGGLFCFHALPKYEKIALENAGNACFSAIFVNSSNFAHSFLVVFFQSHGCLFPEIMV